MVIFSSLKFVFFFFVSFINQVDRYTVFIAESLMNGNCFGLISCERVMCSFNNGHCFLVILSLIVTVKPLTSQQ